MDRNWVASRVLKELQLEPDLKEDDYVRCVNCGSFIHWASNICEICLCDPRKMRRAERSQEMINNFLKQGTHSCQERRASPRIRMQRTFLHDGFLATVQNISQGGVQISTQESLVIGKTVRMAFPLKQGIGRFIGSIIYVSPLSDAYFLAGLKFSKLSHKDFALLKSYLDFRSHKMAGQRTWKTSK